MIKCKLLDKNGLLLKASHIEIRSVERTNLFRFKFTGVKVRHTYEYDSARQPLRTRVRYKVKGFKPCILHKFDIVPEEDFQCNLLDKEVSIVGLLEWPSVEDIYNQSIVDFLTDWENEPYDNWMGKGFDEFQKDALLRVRGIFSGMLQRLPDLDRIEVDFSECKDRYDMWLTLNDACAGKGKHFAFGLDGLHDSLIELANKDKREQKPKFLFLKPQIFMCNDEGYFNKIAGLFREYGYAVEVK